MISTISPARLEQMIRSRWIISGALLDELARRPEFAAAFLANVGVQQSFTLRTHTLCVMDCYEKHFAHAEGVPARSRGLFRLFLALHDIGKPLAIQAGDKRLQHRFTVDLMRRTRACYPVTDTEFSEWIALVDGDPWGEYLKGETTAETAASVIRRMAAGSILPRKDFFKQLMIYYQCDVSAYTRRAGLMNILDGLFEWQTRGDEIARDPETGLLKFSTPIQRLVERLTPERIWPEPR